ncbi:IS200/IS605 family transposase [Nostoc sp. C052]|uniref:IS200/IS605 family transposase n=1 Tax=Nostoc sp. C052 TaxID=2576902 RepID=UPI0035666968
MSLWRLYYHIAWATKERQLLITSDKETDLYNYIIDKSNSLNCRLHAIGGIEDHIHLVVSIPPTIAIAEFVKKIKGSSSHHFNHNLCPTLHQKNLLGKKVMIYSLWAVSNLSKLLYIFKIKKYIILKAR